jgi:hypothetical protein
MITWFAQKYTHIQAVQSFSRATSKFKLGTIRFQVTDMAGSRRDRFIYAGTRASGSLGQIVSRERSLDPLLQLSLSGKF